MVGKSPIVGALDRDGFATIPTEWIPHLGGFVVNSNWTDWQPTSAFQDITGSVGLTALKAAIDFCEIHPSLRIKIRINTGIFSPSWLTTKMGGFVVNDSTNSSWLYWVSGTTYPALTEVVSQIDGNVYRNTLQVINSTIDPSVDTSHWTLRPKANPRSGKLPIWWSSSPNADGFVYADYYRDLMQQIADTSYHALTMEANPSIGDVNMSGCMVTFPEVMERSVNGTSNPDTFNNAFVLAATGNGGQGYTLARDVAAMRSAIDATCDVWATTPVSMCFNEWEVAKAGGGYQNAAAMIETMSYFLNKPGSARLPANNGCQPGFSESIARAISSFGGPINMQTRTADQYVAPGITLVDVILWACRLGACQVEFPHRATTFDHPQDYSQPPEDQGYQSINPLSADMRDALSVLNSNTATPRNLDPFVNYDKNPPFNV